MPIHIFEGEDPSEHESGYLALIETVGDKMVKFSPGKNIQVRGGMTMDVQPFRRGEYMLLIVSDDEDRDGWEENDPTWTNEYFRVYPSLEEALNTLTSHGESENTDGVDIYDFDSLATLEEDIWWV